MFANLLDTSVDLAYGTITYCSTLTDSSFDDQFKRNKCEDINEATGGDIQCTFEIDRLRCLERLLADTADFGVFKAEDLFLAPFLNHVNAGNLVVTNEMRQSMNQSFEFDMVVLVSNGVPVNSLSDLKGLRLCHPGFDENGWLYDWSEIFSQYFEETLIQEQCDPSLSVFENKVKSLNDFFGSACKAGSWSPDPVLDEKFKSKYNRLCANCQIQATCSRNDVYWGQQGPLNCLSDCSGDVAWVRLQDVQFYFRTSVDDLHHVCEDFSFLCPDGSKQHPLNTSNPCVWLSRPWPVILARRTVRERVSSLVQHLSTSNDIAQETSWEYKLRLLLSHSLQPIYSMNPSHLTPHEYLERVPGFLHANTMKTCKGTGEDKTINICTENESVKKKCDLLALVARVYSIDPELNCTLVSNCLKNVAERKGDVVIVNTGKLKQVYEHHDLRPILYQTSTGSEQLRYMFAVVRQGSKINQLKQLRGKKACFTEVGGLGWNSLLMVLKENSLINDYCDEKSAISNFFSEVCIVNSKPGDEFRSCFDDDFEKFDIGSLDLNEAQGLRCISDNNGGDVSFIDFYSIEKYLREYKHKGWFSDYQSKNDFKYICPYKNSTSRDCYLSKSSFGQVLVHKDLPDARIEEISSAFLILSSLLSSDKNLDPVFKMFTHYQDEKNVLFENKASLLESAEDFSRRIEWANNIYELKLKDMVNICREEKKNGANGASTLISITVIYIMLPITHFIFYDLARFYI
ncbi:hypothetical protein V9T40_004862 [Parthenolecanium corni]|uniref:Transferrin n=1 Tax=Parthenolecanium corni TaxID=536013 RepID=A0AAN9TEU8_9HEMI